jgi:hypothetical protein
MAGELVANKAIRRYNLQTVGTVKKHRDEWFKV